MANFNPVRTPSSASNTSADSGASADLSQTPLLQTTLNASKAPPFLGYAQALSAYALWGVFPIYWKFLSGVGPIDIICHRIVWSLVTLLLCITAMRQWPAIWRAVGSLRTLAFSVLAALLITVNWLAFIWAVAHDHILDASLGYFINPLFTVLLAVLLFKEKLSPSQWFAIATAFAGVGIMTIEANRFPWIAAFLATSFASYAAVKKKMQLPAIAGLGLETAILTPIALPLIFYFASTVPDDSPRHLNTWILLALGGPVTTLPLLLFASATKKVPLVAIGMLQYIGPTIQFLIALFVYQEAISTARFIGFCFVWGALAIFTWGTVMLEYRRQQTARIG